MGRGRAKAKQTKVARDLKYNSPSMDLDRLRADLGAGDSPDRNDDIRPGVDPDDEGDPYSYDVDDEFDDEGDDPYGRGRASSR